MPKLKDGRFRKTRDGLWQVRYRRGGNDIQFTLKSTKDDKKLQLPKKQQFFADFAERYFENVKRANVSEETYSNQLRTVRNHIFPVLGNMPLRQITPLKCQELLNGLLAAEKGRTAESVKFLLGEIFRAAVGEKFISESPMKFVKIPKHQTEHGRALTLREAREFLAACETSYYKKQFVLFLYTGIRRNELHGATFDGDFITVANGKCRKGQRQQYRKIPIAPQLRKYLPLTEKELAADNKVMTRAFKKMFPDHHLYDLRHTFTTHAQECGISKSLVDVWTGHVNRSDMTSAVYTHFSEEYQLREIEKFEF